MPLESQYQADLIRRIYDRFEGCLVLKNDTSYLQGIPDLTILWYDRWAVLEVKRSENAPVRPNQPYYINMLSGMSFAAFIYPENEEEVLDALEQALTSRRRARIPQRQ